MRHNLLVLVFSIGLINSGLAQLNEYQYVVVPKILQDFNKENKYNTSTLLKYLLTQNGFSAYYDGDVPKDLKDRCKGLLMDLLDESTMFRTKVVLVLKDCNGSEVFRTMQGESRIKSFKEGYEEAIKEAFQSIKALNYRYEPRDPANTQVTTLNFDKDVKSLNEEAPHQGNKATNPAIVQKATPEVQSYQDKTPRPSEVTKKTEAPTTALAAKPTQPDSGEEVWYAQKLPNGFQLVDSSPRIRLTLRETSLPDVYLAGNEEVRGMVYQKNNRWYFEYYQGEEKVVQTLNIKF